MINLGTKFEVSNITCYEDMKVDAAMISGG